MWARQGVAVCELLSNHLASLNLVWLEYSLSHSSQKLIMNFRLVGKCQHGMAGPILLCIFNYLPNDNILDVTKLKAFADDKNVAQMLITDFDRVENFAGKRRKCWIPAFSPFPAMFSKGFFLRIGKSRDCVVKK